MQRRAGRNEGAFWGTLLRGDVRWFLTICSTDLEAAMLHPLDQQSEHYRPLGRGVAAVPVIADSARVLVAVHSRHSGVGIVAADERRASLRRICPAGILLPATLAPAPRTTGRCGTFIPSVDACKVLAV